MIFIEPMITLICIFFLPQITLIFAEFINEQAHQFHR